MSDARVALVVAPWASTTRPSLAAGILQSLAMRTGVQCASHYANLDFGSIFGARAYESVAGDTSLFPLGEHFFAADLFGREALQSDEFMRRYVRPVGSVAGRHVTFEWDTLCAVRDHIVPSWLDHWTDVLLADGAPVIGFSCVFNQVLPSLALARRLKAARPSLVILMGGPCVHGIMGASYAGAFPHIVDHVFTGEADVVFPAWLAAYRDGGSLSGIPGVTSGGDLALDPILVTNLDDSPTPAFDDFFTARHALHARGRDLADFGVIPFESSRGCWWGAKQHCVFCGLNNEGISFRRKSDARVISEIHELVSRHGERRFAAADNILPHDGYHTLLPALAEQNLGVEYFYEIKANVRRDDVAMLRRAGVLHVQPGIESFADPVLKTMRKGVNGAQNVQLLKWLSEYSIAVTFNILIGFPGETDADYLAMLALLPRLYHLAPPSVGHAIPVEVHRFAPFFDDAEALGIRNVRAASHYPHLIPPDVLCSHLFAYFFDHDIDVDAPIHRHRRALDIALAHWMASARRMTAELRNNGVRIRVSDVGGTVVYDLGRVASLVFVLSDAATSEVKLGRELATMDAAMLAELPRALVELLDVGALVHIGDRVVGCVPMADRSSSADLGAWLERV